jgi:hypothetical protein
MDNVVTAICAIVEGKITAVRDKKTASVKIITEAVELSTGGA